jgi:ISXO2-like transposase domain
MHNTKRKKLLEEGDEYANKTTILGMVERGGELVAKVVPKSPPYMLAITVGETVIKNATLVTDSTNVYQRVISSYNHLSVNHSISEYVNGNAHTNTIEGAFSHFKRMVYGIYHHITPKHTQRYCDEFSYRYNLRKMNDADRFVLTLTK